MKKFSLYAAVSIAALAGCRTTPPASAPFPEPTAPPLDVSKLENRGAAYFAKLDNPKPGMGLFVFAPIAKSNPADTGLAEGCARWLQLTVGGAPELTQTPLWSERAILQTQLERRDLALDPEQARKAASLVGASHYVTGEIASGKLTLQLHRRDGATVGAPIVLSADATGLAKVLPEAARSLRKALGLPNRDASTLTETVGELALLGRLPSVPERNLSETDATALRKIARRSPLAGTMYIATSPRTERAPEPMESRIRRLLQQAGSNPLVLAEASLRSRSPEVAAAVEKAAPTIRGSLAFAICRAEQSEKREDRLAAAENAVRAAPKSATAWLTLSRVSAEMANDLRRGRSADQISGSEFQTLETLYGREVAAAVRAVSLNPESGSAHLELSRGATFAGDRPLALEAIRRAMDLALRRRGAPSVFFWAIECNAAKWGGSPEDQRSAADRAATLPATELHQAVEVMKTLMAYEFVPQGHILARTILTECDRRIQADASDMLAHDARKAALMKLGKKPEAVEEALKCVALRPDDAEEHNELAQCLRGAKRGQEAVEEARKATALDPKRADFQHFLGETLITEKRFAEAVAPTRAALALAPERIDSLNQLGALLGTMGDPKGALPYFQKALNLSPSDPLTMCNAGETLCRLGKVAEGRPMVEEAMRRTQDPKLLKNGKAVLAEFPASP